EDGIRDKLVTGVQTCALPISLGTGIAVAFPRSPMNLANIGYDLQSFSQGRFVLGLGSQIKAHIEKRFSATWSHPAARMRELILEIGRASCRERGGISVGGGCV